VKNEMYPSVSDVSQKWLETKQRLVSQSIPDTQIDDFLYTLNKFYTSPVGSLYRTHRPGEMDSIKEITPMVNNLKTAILNNNREVIFQDILEIDKAINLLQRIDSNLSETSQLHYFLLFFFFALLVISSILGLRMLYGRLEKAEIREKQSLAFSRETVIAQEQERSRIARELHDTVSQDLWRLMFQTDIMGKTADAGERGRLCAEVVGGQKELMQRVRTICDDLIPPDFERRGLGDALRSLCYNFRQRTGIECQATIQNDIGLEALDSVTQLQCFRIVQECLANIEKHSGATEVSALVRKGIPFGRQTAGPDGSPHNQENEIFICISDNGRGISPKTDFSTDRDSARKLRASGHFGLWNMYERAASLNGKLTVDSEAGEGTTVTLRLPVKGE
jgi:signal transduction histidine kinase